MSETNKGNTYTIPKKSASESNLESTNCKDESIESDLIRCKECGAVLLPFSIICPNCNKSILENKKKPKDNMIKSYFHFSKTKIYILITAIVLATIIGSFIIFYQAKADLKSQLKRDWIRLDMQNNYETIELDFGNDFLKLNRSNEVFEIYDYKVKTFNKISINSKIYVITFNAAKTTVTFKPALTIADNADISSETFYNFPDDPS